MRRRCPTPATASTTTTIGRWAGAWSRPAPPTRTRSTTAPGNSRSHVPEKWEPVPACAKPWQGVATELDASAGEGRFRKGHAQLKSTAPATTSAPFCLTKERNETAGKAERQQAERSAGGALRAARLHDPPRAPDRGLAVPR